VTLEAALYNGEHIAGLPLGDRGLHYGDGVFRTMRIAHERIVAWPYHWERLAADCERLALRVPARAVLESELAGLCAGRTDGVLKLMVTRGEGGRGYTPNPEAPGARLLFRYPAPTWPPEHAREGVDAGVCEHRLARNPALAGPKHLNRLDQVMARTECRRLGVPEALMRDTEGWVVSGTMSNLFAVLGGTLVTPPLDVAGVAGATRQRLLAAAERHGRGVAIRRLTVADCLSADALFFCNSLMEIWPVRSLDGRCWPVAAEIDLCRQWLEACR